MNGSNFGYFQQRTRAAFHRTLDVQCGDNPNVCVRFRQSEFWWFCKENLLLPEGWNISDDGYFYRHCKATVLANIPSETDKNGKRIINSGFVVRMHLDDFPMDIPENDWINGEIYYQTRDSSEPQMYFPQHKPLSGPDGYLMLTVDDKTAVYDDTAGNAHGVIKMESGQNRNFIR